MRTLQHIWENTGLAAVLVTHHIDAAEYQVMQDIIEREWEFFDKVEGLDGRARCQDNAPSFVVMRLAQHAAFSAKTRALILADLKDMGEEGRNPIIEKYARMMQLTDPQLYEGTWKHQLPALSPIKLHMMKCVHDVCAVLYAQAVERYPQVEQHARPAQSQSEQISALDYLVAEMGSYSYATLCSMFEDLEASAQGAGMHVNTIETIWRLTVELQRALA